MSKLFCTSDIHSYYSIFKAELDKQGFDINNSEHKLLICGDLFDRGDESKELLEFLLSIPEDRLILIRGNHEDLFEDCLSELRCHFGVSRHHISNGTLGTISQLAGIEEYRLTHNQYDFIDISSELDDYYKLVNRAINYYETDKYIFVHGFIPCNIDDLPIYYQLNRKQEYLSNWRDLDDLAWNDARWVNGIKACFNGLNQTGKTIVVGHWHASLAWYLSDPEKYKGEFDIQGAKFDTYISKDLIALDACTAFSKKVNVLVLED